MTDPARDSAVWLSDDDGLVGCGFFLAPGVVLTAAHVAAAARGPLLVRWGGRTAVTGGRRLFPAVRGDGTHWAHPDLALVAVPGAPGEHRAPRLAAGDDVPPGTVVRVWGYSTRTPSPGVQPDALLLRVTGPAGDYVRVAGDAVLDGFSGSVVVRQDDGAVCGVLKAFRKVSGVMDGGWYTPLAALRKELPGDDPLFGLLPPPTAVRAAPPPYAGPRRLTAAARLRLAQAFEAVPGMDDPEFRRRVLRDVEEELGTTLHVPHQSETRGHVLAMVDALRAHDDPPRARQAFTDVVAVLRPGAAARLGGALEADL
ncbi:trypsin-like peptidase domain-containing protein [Streptomyces sp. NPDC049881]|uniref:effector-associated domain 2-containing protein n=1 Tax=Streptomyces sp. NPDC049881 TaxID=3155778 RepID=UPI0034420BFB